MTLPIAIRYTSSYRKLQLARFEWTHIAEDNFGEDVRALLHKLKACLDDDVDGVKEEVRDGKLIDLVDFTVVLHVIIL